MSRRQLWTVGMGLPAMILMIAPAALAADSENVTVLGNTSWSSWHADLWGYHDGAGNEFGIVGAYSETKFFDVTDPTNPIEIASFPGVDTIWRDIKTYGDYAYVVNDDLGDGGHGLVIIDISDPFNPTFVREVTSEFETAHNVWIDVDAGLLFANGTDIYSEGGDATEIYDLTGDPSNPTHVYTFDNYYAHDMYSRDGVAYFASVYDGFLGLVDISDVPTSMPELSRIDTDGHFTHNIWVTEDGNYALAGDEVSGGPLTVIDVSDPENPVRVTSWFPPEDPDATMHNVIVKGDIAYIGWYKAGMQVLDVSDPANPQRVAYYDSFEGEGSGYEGSWGTYPYLPSGTILMSDINTGLYTFAVETAMSVPGLGESLIVTQLAPLGNPFKTSTLLRFELASPQDVVVDVVDAQGRLVRRLASGAFTRGAHSLTWDGRDATGLTSAPGVYLVQLRAGHDTAATKLVRTN